MISDVADTVASTSAFEESSFCGLLMRATDLGTLNLPRD
jgi:hypothetical protein